MKRELTRKQIILLGLGFGLFCAVAIILALINFIIHTGKRELYIGYAPFTASVKIDNRSFPNNTNSWLTLGQHEIIVSLNDFETITKTINITEETIGVYGLLQPKSEQGEKIKSSHLADYQKIEGYYGIEANIKGEKEKQTYPILNHLPYKNSLFTLGYTTNNNIPTLTISTSESYLDQAVAKLKTLDNNLEKYNLEIKSPINPFQNTQKQTSTESDPMDFILTTYQNLGIDFDVYPGEEDGDYYYTKITTGKPETYNLITYKVILKKNNNSYQLLTDYPSPIINIYNTKDTPTEILKKANNL